jgi:hypothetical protein
MGSVSPKIGNEIRNTQATTRAYRFVTTVEGARIPLRFEVDCDSDRDATLLALTMADTLTTIEVWAGNALIFRVPSIGETLDVCGIENTPVAVATAHAQQ